MAVGVGYFVSFTIACAAAGLLLRWNIRPPTLMADETMQRAAELSAYPHHHRFTVPVEWAWDEWSEVGPRYWHVTILRCELCDTETLRRG